VGDSPYSGTQLIELPDLSQMMAEVKINEVDITKIKTGLDVQIRPDAYSDTVYPGKITTVANLAQNKDAKSKIKIFPVQIGIGGASRNLLPGLTVSCKIIISQKDDVLYIPAETIFKKEGKEFVYIKSGSGFKRQDVVLGSQNTDFVIVQEGLKENDELALSDPYTDKQEVQENKAVAAVKN
jgi:hypothetical protein